MEFDRILFFGYYYFFFIKHFTVHSSMDVRSLNNTKFRLLLTVIVFHLIIFIDSKYIFDYYI